MANQTGTSRPSSSNLPNEAQWAHWSVYVVKAIEELKEENQRLWNENNEIKDMLAVMRIESAKMAWIVGLASSAITSIAVAVATGVILRQIGLK